MPPTGIIYMKANLSWKYNTILVIVIACYIHSIIYWLADSDAKAQQYPMLLVYMYLIVILWPFRLSKYYILLPVLLLTLCSTVQCCSKLTLINPINIGAVPCYGCDGTWTIIARFKYFVQSFSRKLNIANALQQESPLSVQWPINGK